MIIKKMNLRHLKMTMKNPFVTSFGSMQEKEFFLLEVFDEDGNSGWGESAAFQAPWYTEETVQTTLHMIRDFLIPLLLNKEINHPDEVSEIFSPIRKNNMAKATVEGAIWDLYAKRNKQSLAQAIGGVAKQIEVGISIGIQTNTEKLLEVVHHYIEEGYKRIKLKIKPGYDIEVIQKLRDAFPEVPLMADANSAYTLQDIELLKKLDDYHLLMIEQPLASDDIVDHAKLQKMLNTPICLDESILSVEDVRKAIELGSTKVINIKIARVGGLTEAKKIHDYCMEKGIPVWCGGMLEAGIGRAHNIALTTLPNFALPGDTAGSSHYWEEDIISPEIVVVDGYIEVPKGYGIGFEPNMEVIERYMLNEIVFE
ncbi:o-succinylbenzoate synthase [Psychrobacillus psychrodurans]|uniref:o-succinylbenzoate synthase n=1 Tax=Psychrobacillus psychrodurans TaxID=126157 RepID=A0A9X3L985_9BACI|nr:o-succinylbenzoate synthase [Psychrobacillus psychrodurans]MCZ8531879.1 o-succinylbenzoate synthase [Psychrobacillus psychrodurans]